MSSRKKVVLSLDAELIWGFHDQDDIPAEQVRHARDSWLYTLDLFDRYGVPATWAVVGHLFLDSCDGVHADHPAGAEWFARDPGGTATPDSEWFGGELIDAIRDSEVDHDVGSHTFSHVEFGRSDVSKEVARAELEYSVGVADEYDLEFASFVFPRNNVGHRELLADYGFSCYRGVAPERWYDGTPVRRMGKFATFALGTGSPPIVDPELDEYGLVDVPASMYLFSFEGLASDIAGGVTGDPVVSQVELGLDKLRERGDGTLHLWFHPNNLTSAEDRRRLEQIVSRVAEYRDQYDVAVQTMSRVADEVRARG
ncbi:polysaccharide deacetylase family protein [Salinirubrum litoreum]|uniref:Polysaccharide deacetylase family protein n=1 Tax=Salinirubrum litoreum TaxID=1126234 RepID=A0ABD5R8Z5_9EURY|nr:polysaccharide deacetylase family protein [Salinirubrum litoreum]